VWRARDGGPPPGSAWSPSLLKPPGIGSRSVNTSGIARRITRRNRGMEKSKKGARPHREKKTTVRRCEDVLCYGRLGQHGAGRIDFMGNSECTACESSVAGALDGASGP